ncbi:K(+)/H(+) antiporter [Marasmius tenuissimus]|nr:K(+)/H(+) antiporter [Marasmius tenuissimus]
MGQFSENIVLARDLLVKRAAADQGGILSGDNPARYNESDPIRLWVIQLVIIICFTQILALGLGRIRQPRVIAEVIAGILLGPSVMGRIPNFQNTIFPKPSMPLLSLTANIGLVLFLFLVGMEIDTRVLKRNLRASACISAAGLIVPLGLGAALGVGVYREFVLPSVNFGYFILFIAIAIGITAFPVLCRILTETKLLDTTVGVVTLSAGIGNDVVGWILLALTVSLVNAASGLTALYVLITCVGFTAFLLWPVRWAYVWLARKTGSLEHGAPTTLMMTVTLLLVYIAAFFTDVIGVHAIFGGFLVGLIIPKENGYTISIVEKIEDLVSILLLPLYFTLSGLRTNLGLLDNGVTWGYIILICLVAFTSKFFSCALTAQAFGFNWREAGAIGSLMSCKGLVELIVLNIGFQAGILDGRTFSMFVVHAIVLTFITTPLTLWFYPERVRHYGLRRRQACSRCLGERKRGWENC